MSTPLLVIDDDWEIRSILQELLEKGGYGTETAGDRPPAWETLDCHVGCYEVVLVDALLSKKDGQNVVQTSQQHESAPLRLIVALNVDHEAIQQVAATGMYRVLAKPFGLKTLVILIPSFHAPHVFYGSTCLVQ